MNAYVGITDSNWFNLLASQPGIQEINFWQPGGKQQFKALNKGELFLFKPHRKNVIFGGGIFAYSTLLPLSLAWQAFGIGNGVRSHEDMRFQIEKYRSQSSSRHKDYTIGCIILTQPFFFKEENWIPLPNDWNRNIVQGKRYDLIQEPGLLLFKAVSDQMHLSYRQNSLSSIVAEPPPRYGTPVLIEPRLGQGAFRVVVTDAYERRCAVSGEKVLPVLEAAHVKPYVDGGEHRIENGLLLRSDLHTLFDRGYVTVSPDFHFEVSKRIREDYDNGRDYYALHGKSVREPKSGILRPSQVNLEWHNSNIYLG